jgi:heterodisulfide reductase subunit D
LVFQDDFPITDDLIKIIYTCTGCGMCNEICPTYLPLYAIEAMREEIVGSGNTLPEPLPEIFGNIKQSHNLFERNIRGKAKAKVLEGLPAKGEDIYFSGCYASYRVPNVAKATVDVLRTAGINVAHLGNEERCCGFIPRHAGNRSLFLELALHNVEAMKKAGAKRVILSCAHGYSIWKREYPKIVGQLPFKVTHVAELFAKLIDEGKIKFRKDVKQKITYHDPCFLGRHLKVYDEPRKVLKNIPGVEITEMERYGKWAYCCGAGAKITLNCYPDFAGAVAKERLLEAKEVADTVVTACPVCFDHMRSTVKKEKIGLQIYDLPVFVAEAMEIQS